VDQAVSLSELAYIPSPPTAPLPTARESSPQSRPKLTVYDHRKINTIAQLSRLPAELADGIRLAARVFPFKVNDYVLNTLIDWTNVPDDPLFRLTFPHPDMLDPDDAEQLRCLVERGAKENEIAVLVDQIRSRMNPHPSDQAINIPTFGDVKLEGVQHKYPETVLFFPKQGQTCHSYCTFCFRWPQFVQGSAHKFASQDAATLHDYLRANRQVTDVLITGGDPMVMGTRRLGEYLEPLLSEDLRHIQNIRIGTKALSYWPYRFLTEDDSDDLIALFRKLVDNGKHIAVMAHISHWRELATAPFQEAVKRLQQAGVVIRSQSPILRHINDDAEVWRRSWRDQVRLGIVPYYMFVERDTGAHRYFGVPLARALSIYQSALSTVSGIARTARGPVMSASPGKIQVIGTIELSGSRYFLLNFLQARRTEWLSKPFLARYSETASWINELSPPNSGEQFFFEQSYRALFAQEHARLYGDKAA
jgi:KamA family protein